MNKKLNGNLARWIIVAFAVGGFIYNTGIIHNHVKTNAKSITRVETKVDAFYALFYKFLMDDKD